MQILATKGWSHYALLDSGNGYRLEKFGQYILKRPDPQTIWQKKQPQSVWDQSQARYLPAKNNSGSWQSNSLPEKWKMTYQDYQFFAKLTPFKHTGVFPEQQLNWDFLEFQLAKQNRPVKLLNLFAYTGIASLIAAKNQAFVTHVDASKSSIEWAKENARLSQVAPDRIRWIIDDAQKFVQREIRRQSYYDAVILDPPVYGHGPGGETWDFFKDFPNLLKSIKQLLNPQPLFVVANAYAVSASAIMLNNLFQDNFVALNGQFDYGELALQELSSSRLLSTGIFSRWTNQP
jgi:23S rRNA (cytosine1962-C5)-methyltransferase